MPRLTIPQHSNGFILIQSYVKTQGKNTHTHIYKCPHCNEQHTYSTYHVKKGMLCPDTRAGKTVNRDTRTSFGITFNDGTQALI